jgi:hypothetical protein
MPSEYRVISAAELALPPSVMQMPATRVRQYADDLQTNFNGMATDGWELVTNCTEPWSGAVLFIFRREYSDDAQGHRKTGITKI